MKHILFRSKKLLHHELISGSSFMFVGSVVGNICAFLFNLVVARKLSTIDYGIYASLLSLFSLTILIPQSFLATIVQFATKYFSLGKTEQAKKLYRQTMGLLSVVGIVIFLGIVFFAHSIGVFLHIANSWYIVAVGIIIFFSFISSVNISYLQSLLAFGFISVIQALGAFIKLITGMLFLFLGFGMYGALGAVLLSFLVPFGAAFVRLKFLLAPMEKEMRVPLWDVTTYAIPSMVTAIALSSFISTDVILAKHFLSSTNAGLYAGLSLVGKVIFYFTGIIPTVMFPVLIRKFTKGHGVQSTFYLGLLLVAVPSFCITIFYFLFPHFVITLFLGGKQYLLVAGELGFMALFLTLYSIVSVMVNFFLSLKQTKVVFPVFTMALLQIVFIILFHTSIIQFITVSVVISAILIVFLSLYYMYHSHIVKTYAPQENALQEI